MGDEVYEQRAFSLLQLEDKRQNSTDGPSTLSAVRSHAAKEREVTISDGKGVDFFRRRQGIAATVAEMPVASGPEMPRFDSHTNAALAVGITVRRRSETDDVAAMLMQALQQVRAKKDAA